MSDVFSSRNGQGTQICFKKVVFNGVTLARMQLTLHYANDDDGASAVFEGGPAALPYSRFDAATKQRVKEHYLQTIQSFKNPIGSYEIPGEFVIVLGYK